MSQDAQRLQAWTDSLAAMAAALRDDLAQAGADATRQQQAICETLARTAESIGTQAQAQPVRPSPGSRAWSTPPGRPQRAGAEADHRGTAAARRPAGRLRTGVELDGDHDSTAPVWAAFGDLMSVLLGVFVLILVGVIGVQLQLEMKLDAEIAQREAEERRRQTLEQAHAAPLAAGRITLVDGRIGIRGSVLFAQASASCSPTAARCCRAWPRRWPTTSPRATRC